MSGNGTLGRFLNLAYGIGATAGADRHSAPKKWVQVFCGRGIRRALAILLCPILLGVLNVAQVAGAGDRILLRIQRWRCVVSTPAEGQEQQGGRRKFRQASHAQFTGLGKSVLAFTGWEVCDINQSKSVRSPGVVQVVVGNAPVPTSPSINGALPRIFPCHL